MRLSELQPKFMKWTDDTYWHETDTIEGADGIIFLCPRCFAENGGPVGTESVICWSPSVPQTTSPKPGRWNLVGTSFEDLSLVAGSSSVLLTGHAHFHVTNGEIIHCPP